MTFEGCVLIPFFFCALVKLSTKKYEGHERMKYYIKKKSGYKNYVMNKNTMDVVLTYEVKSGYWY